ncbi:MAG: hypothetical protein ACREC0_08795, partial [Methylocella sp.]
LQEPLACFARMIAAETIGAAPTIGLRQSVEALYPLPALIHVFERGIIETTMVSWCRYRVQDKASTFDLTIRRSVSALGHKPKFKRTRYPARRLAMLEPAGSAPTGEPLLSFGAWRALQAICK